MVEQATENRCVGGSIPPLGTIIMKMKYISLISLFFLISCDKKTENFFPIKKGIKWFYSIKIKSSYTGKENIKKLMILNVDSKNSKGVHQLSRLHSDGSFYKYNIDKKKKNVFRTSVILAFDEGLVEPIKKLVYPDFEFKEKQWKIKEQLFLVRGFQPPLLNVKPRSQFEMNYKIKERIKNYKANGKVYNDCLKVKGTGETSFIGDTRSGPIKVEIINTEWICVDVGLVKQIRQENTNASAFGNMQLSKHLVDFR